MPGAADWAPTPDQSGNRKLEIHMDGNGVNQDLTRTLPRIKPRFLTERNGL